jgi:hypothetical protein
MPDHLYMSVSVESAQSYVAASNQDRRRSLLAEKKIFNREKREDAEKPKNNQAAQAIEQAGKKAGGINQGQAGEDDLQAN